MKKEFFFTDGKISKMDKVYLKALVGNVVGEIIQSELAPRHQGRPTEMAKPAGGQTSTKMNNRCCTDIRQMIRAGNQTLKRASSIK